MDHWFERSHPYLAAALAAGVSFYFQWPTPEQQAIRDLMSASISLAGIAFGFIATALSIFVAIDNSPIMQFLKKVKRYDHVVNYLHAAIIWSFVWALTSGLAILLGTSQLAHARFWGSVYLGVVTLALLTLLRVASILPTILKQNGKDPGIPNKKSNPS